MKTNHKVFIKILFWFTEEIKERETGGDLLVIINGYLDDAILTRHTYTWQIYRLGGHSSSSKESLIFFFFFCFGF